VNAASTSPYTCRYSPTASYTDSAFIKWLIAFSSSTLEVHCHRRVDLKISELFCIMDFTLSNYTSSHNSRNYCTDRRCYVSLLHIDSNIYTETSRYNIRVLYSINSGTLSTCTASDKNKISTGDYTPFSYFMISSYWSCTFLQWPLIHWATSVPYVTSMCELNTFKTYCCMSLFLLCSIITAAVQQGPYSLHAATNKPASYYYYNSPACSLSIFVMSDASLG